MRAEPEVCDRQIGSHGYPRMVRSLSLKRKEVAEVRSHFLSAT